MSRELVLHIGSHKTGSTTLQRTPRANKPRLREQGWPFAHPETCDVLHKFLGFDAAPLTTRGFVVKDRQGLATSLRNAPTDRVIASSENLSFMFDQVEITRLNPDDLTPAAALLQNNDSDLSGRLADLAKQLLPLRDVRRMKLLKNRPPE